MDKNTAGKIKTVCNFLTTARAFGKIAISVKDGGDRIASAMGTMTKQMRYGSGNADKVRVASITSQQIEELTQVTGLTQAGVMQEAVSRLYMQIIHNAQAKELADLRAAYDECYAALCAAQK